MSRKTAAILISAFSLLVYFISSTQGEIPHPLSGFTFLTGLFFAGILLNVERLKRLFAAVRNPIKTYGFLMLGAGIILELFAYIYRKYS